MAVDIDSIGLSVDTREVKAASKDLDNFGRSADKASRQADNFGKTTDKGVSMASSAMVRFGGVVGVAYAAYQTFQRTISSADTSTRITAQIKLATNSQEQYNAALADVTRIANKAQADLEAVSKLYTRLSGSLSELGVEQRKVADISETVALALRVSGAQAGETASVMLQLSQAFGSGVLRGDEFNSMAENSPILLRALAASMGVTTGALRDMASEGLITRDVLLKAFGDEKLLEKLRLQAKEVGTIGSSLTTVKNVMVELIGTIDKSTGASAWVQSVFGNLAEYLKAMKLTIESGTWFEKLRFFTIGNLSERLTNQLRNPAGSSASGNSLPGARGITGGSSPFPNFVSPRAVEDIEVVHRKQEEYRAKAQEAAKKAQEADTTRRMGALQLYWENESIRLERFADKKAEQYELEIEADKAEYKRKTEYMKLLQKQANDNFDEAQKKVKELEQEAKRASDEIGRSLTDALLRGFERGKSFADNFKDTLINVFKTLVLQPIIRFLVDSSGITKVLGGLGSLFSGSAAAGGGSSGGFGDLGSIFSSVKNIFTNGLESANIAFEQSIQEFGTFITKFGSFGESIGGAISQYSGAISNVLPYAGAFMKLLQGDVKGAAITATTTAIGSIFGPIGAGIGAVVGSLLGGMMGGGLPPRVTESRTATSSGGVTSFFNGADPGKRKLGAASALDGLNEAFINNLNTLFGAFGVSDDITANSLLTKKKNTRSRFNATVNGQFLGYEEINLGKKGNFQDAFNQMMEAALGGYTVKAIQASSLPEGIKQFFEGLVKKEDVADTISTLIGMKNALLDLPDVFDAVRNAMDTTAYKTTIDQLKAQFQATQTFVDLFYSSTEKFDIFTNQLITQFDALNQTIPTSRDQYRALVESINVVDEATRDQFNGLIALAPAMNQYFEYLEQTADGINQVNEALAQALDKNLFSTYADYVTAQANASAGMSYTGSIGDLSVRRSQGDAELANAVKSLVAQQARTDQILAEIAKSTRETAELNKTWNGDGLPETRVM